MTRQEHGQRAEHIALRLLQQNEFELLHQNYRCRFGEIDIVAKRKQLIIFVEVRYRKNTLYGSASESVTKNKQKKITITARHYIQQHISTGTDFDYRFDVIALSTLNSTQAAPDWIQGAW